MGAEAGVSSDWNTYVRDNLNYLKGIAAGVTFSGVNLTRTANQSTSDSTSTKVDWSAENYDYGGWWSSGTDIIVPAGAIPTGFTTIAVLVMARIKWASNGTGLRYVYLMLNGAEFGSISTSALTGDTTSLSVPDVAIAAAGGVITVEAKQTSGGVLNIASNQVTVLRYAPAA